MKEKLEEVFNDNKTLIIKDSNGENLEVAEIKFNKDNNNIRVNFKDKDVENVKKAAEEFSGLLEKAFGGEATLTIDGETFTLSDEDVITKLAKAILGDVEPKNFTGTIEVNYKATVGEESLEGSVTFTAPEQALQEEKLE